MRLLVLLPILTLFACTPTTQVKQETKEITFEVISRGEPVDLMFYVKADTITVFDFYADWCPPCKELDKSLLSLKKTYGNRLTVYKMDLVNWESNMSDHYQVKDLPYLIVYDKNKNEVKGASKDVLPKLISMLNES